LARRLTTGTGPELKNILLCLLQFNILAFTKNSFKIFLEIFLKYFENIFEEVMTARLLKIPEDYGLAW